MEHSILLELSKISQHLGPFLGFFHVLLFRSRSTGEKVAGASTRTRHRKLWAKVKRSKSLQSLGILQDTSTLQQSILNLNIRLVIVLILLFIIICSDLLVRGRFRIIAKNNIVVHRLLPVRFLSSHALIDKLSNRTRLRFLELLLTYKSLGVVGVCLGRRGLIVSHFESC